MLVISRFTLKTDIPLFKHQETARNFITSHGGSGALYLDMGLGKTRTVLEIYKELKQTCSGLRMVVIAPLSLLESAWHDDIVRFTDFTFYNAHDNGINLSTIADIVVINYEAIIQKKNAQLVWLIENNLLVIDESARMKNPESQTTKMLLSWKNLPAYKIIMSGVPAPNSPLEYWAQIEFLQSGLLGVSFSQFRNMFFTLSRGSQVILDQGQVNPQYVGQMLKYHKITVGQANLLLKGIVTKHLAGIMFSTGAEYTISDENLAKLMNLIKPLVFWAKKSECLDLPDQIDEVRMVELGDKQRRAYREMKTQLITEIRGQTVTAPIALTKIMKLREITSGFAFDVCGTEAEIGECPKIAELEDILEEAGPQPVIIWAVFKWDIRRIESFLVHKYGEGCCKTLYSEAPDRLESINDFKVGKVRFLVAHPASGAHGLTFVNCCMQVFYSLDYSLERYEQAKARIHRAGQVNNCTYVHILARGTIDEEVLQVLRSKGDINAIAYRFMKDG